MTYYHPTIIVINKVSKIIKFHYTSAKRLETVCNFQVFTRYSPIGIRREIGSTLLIFFELN